MHFHINPCSGDVPKVKARSWTAFGRGQREKLDEEEAEVLIRETRRALVGEVEEVRAREGEAAIEASFEVGGIRADRRERDSKL